MSGRCHWKIAPDEVLIVEVPQFEAYYWSIDLLGFWFASLDYRYRLTSVNSTQAHWDDDGLARLVVSAEDPGVANWLDTSGWSEGLLEARANQCATAPALRTRVVPFRSLGEYLPASTRFLSAEERIAQRRERRLGVWRRFGDY